MSTRGLIAIEAADRSCRSIYVHFDLYPSGAGVCLTAHYNTKERIEALFALGDLSGLGGRLSNGDPEPDAQDVCHAYHRDYGEKLCPPRVWADADEMLARAADARRQVVCEYDIPSERVAAGRRGAQGAEQWLKSNGKSPNRC